MAGPLAAILWGANAQTLKAQLGPVPWVASVHPCPLSAHKGFFGSRPFSRVNRLLEEQGGTRSTGPGLRSGTLTRTTES